MTDRTARTTAWATGRTTGRATGRTGERAAARAPGRTAARLTERRHPETPPDRPAAPRPGGTPPAGAAEDALDRTLREVRTLLESTVHEHRARQSRDALFTEVGVADAAFLAAAEEVVGRAVHSVDAAFPEPTPRLAADHAALHALVSGVGDTGTGSDTATVTGTATATGSGTATGTATGSGTDARPVEVRVLRTRPLAEPGPALGPGGGLGARPPEIRIAAVPLPTAVIADGRTALVCTDTAEGRRASLVRDPAVVATLLGMFGHIWRTAAPAARPLDFGNRARTEMVRRVLRRLGDGVTDEAAARELAISVRTYRRYVTGILELLEVNSRFQAGVRACELGILDRFSTGS
ncbi:DNA-binding response regulator [Streptomyces sparsogenes]|uniref:helix-turn-helix transcriptional regulator n=1 Tax=Streptomyces sparsogenes TaxID=67365 RepID=UPI0033F5DB0B